MNLHKYPQSSYRSFFRVQMYFVSFLFFRKSKFFESLILLSLYFIYTSFGTIEIWTFHFAIRNLDFFFKNFKNLDFDENLISIKWYRIRRTVSLSVLSGNQRWILSAIEAAIFFILGAASLIKKIIRKINKHIVVKFQRYRSFFHISYKFQSARGAIEAVSAFASVVFSISRIVLHPRWHETVFQLAIVDICGVGRSAQVKVKVNIIQRLLL